MAIWNNTSNPAIASGNLLDINAAINGGTDSLSQVWGANTVKDGDTVVIPNGTWDWNNAASGLTNGLTYTKGIILKGGTTVAGNHTTDAKDGARFVARYNTWLNCGPTDHGTEGGPERGVRCGMIYGNLL